MMAEVVYKYPVNSDAVLGGRGTFGVEMPMDARVVLAGMQAGVLTLWAIVNPDNDAKLREFCLRGTGQEIPTNGKHIHSFIHDGGAFVWHLFEPSLLAKAQAQGGVDG